MIDGNTSNFNFIKLEAKLNSQIIQEYEQGNRKEAEKTKKTIPIFLETINSFFANTQKSIHFTDDKNIVIKTPTNSIEIHQLSAGEKQLLIIFFSIFLQEQKPHIILLDEPEISLHLNWQEKLIDTILEINPNCQLLIATHAPSIFGKGWGDKFINIQSITQQEL